MVLTKQQRYLKGVIESLGCIREDQLIALFRPAFCQRRPDKAEHITASALHSLLYCDRELRREGSIWHTRRTVINAGVLEAIDVMLELSDSRPIGFCAGNDPVLLRFQVQEKIVRSFLVAAYGARLSQDDLAEGERIVLLFDGQGRAQPLSVSNKQFFAVRQSDGTHCFFAAGGQEV